MASKGNKGKTHSRYTRFYGLISGKTYIDKDDMVLQFTDGRTTHINEMTNAEFEEMCDTISERNLQDRNSYKEKVRKARSSVLLRIGRLGINTVDNWDEVNAFLMSPKIAGKLLYEMSLDELKSLVKKLEAIIRHGGLKSIRDAEKAEADAKNQEDLIRQLALSQQRATNQPQYLS